MTDLRARLADALREHWCNFNTGKCNCGDAYNDIGTILSEHAKHLADVLLSLDGIAIVELPEATAAGNFPTEEVEDPRVWQVRPADAGTRTPLVSYGEKLMPTWYARRLAAALLAAANAAEEQLRDRHDFEAGFHDDECTHSSDGTWATYCGKPCYEHPPR